MILLLLELLAAIRLLVLLLLLLHLEDDERARRPTWPDTRVATSLSAIVLILMMMSRMSFGRKN
jgi:hypothetical protein